MSSLDDLDSALERIRAAKAAKSKEPTAPSPEEAFEFDESLEQDLLDAISLLSKCMHLMDYVGDMDKVTKRELSNMRRLSADVKDFLDAVEDVYVDEGEE